MCRRTSKPPRPAEMQSSHLPGSHEIFRGSEDDGSFSTALSMLSIREIESMNVAKYGSLFVPETGVLSLRSADGVAHNEHRPARFSNEEMNVTAEELSGRWYS